MWFKGRGGMGCKAAAWCRRCVVAGTAGSSAAVNVAGDGSRAARQGSRVGSVR